MNNPSEAVFCAYCGSKVLVPSTLVDIEPGDRRNDDSDAFRHIRNHRGWLITALSHREHTDKLIEKHWLFMPLVGTTITMIGIFIVMFGLVAGLTVMEFGIVVYLFGAVITGGVLAQLNYRMLDRQDGHDRRERIVRFRVLSYLKERATAMDVLNAIQPQLTVIEHLNAESKNTERNQPTLKWTILSYLPLLQLYVLYRMTRFTSDHDRRWTIFIQQVHSAGPAIGYAPMLPPYKSKMPKPILIYLLVSIIFLPFITYWYTDLIKDLEEHFKAQWQFEDQLVAQMK